MVYTGWSSRNSSILITERKVQRIDKKMLITMGESTLGGEEITLKIPPGVLHGCKVLSEISHLFYITSTTYNPQDEGRLPYNTEVVPHIWGDNLIVAENDKKSFKPIAKRTKI